MARAKTTAKVVRIHKVRALQKRPGTAGEGQAATAALARIGPVAPRQGSSQTLSDSVVKKLPLPAKGNRIFWDDQVPGLGARVTAAGSRSYVLDYRTKAGRQRRYTIGSAGDWTAGAARIEGRKLRRQIDEGGDPLGDVQAEREAPTVNELIERFQNEHLPRLRASSAFDYRNMIAKHIAPALGRLRVHEVSFSDVDRLHRRITNDGYSYRANRVIAVLSRMLALSVHWGMRDDNPCKNIERNLEYHRRRYLQGDELARLLRALKDYPDQNIANIFRILTATGSRRGEVLSMRWADLDFEKSVWSKQPSSTKQKEFHEVPLSAPVKQLLLEIRKKAQTANKRQLPEFVFPGTGARGHVVEVKKAWRRICRDAGISNLRIHDLRHSFASQVISDGSSLALVGALLGHSNPSTTARYAHLMPNPMAQAVERVGATIAAADAGQMTETKAAPAPAKKAPRRGR
jgi:integrase